MLYTFYFYVIFISPVCDSYVLVCLMYVTHTTSTCHSYVLVVIHMSLACHPYVTRMCSYVLLCTCTSFVCHSYVIRISVVCTHTSSVSHSYVLIYHSYVTCMYSYVIRMLLGCTFISLFVCHSYVVLHGQINLIKFIELNKFDNFDKIQILRHNRLLVFGIKNSFFVAL